MGAALGETQFSSERADGQKKRHRADSANRRNSSERQQRRAFSCGPCTPPSTPRYPPHPPIPVLGGGPQGGAGSTWDPGPTGLGPAPPCPLGASAQHLALPRDPRRPGPRSGRVTGVVVAWLSPLPSLSHLSGRDVFRASTLGAAPPRLPSNPGPSGPDRSRRRVPGRPVVKTQGRYERLEYSASFSLDYICWGDITSSGTWVSSAHFRYEVWTLHCAPTSRSPTVFRHHVLGPFTLCQPRPFPPVAATLSCVRVSVSHPTDE